jgi:hypothetical protein
VTFSIAAPTDGLRIRQLLLENGQADLDWLDWSDIGHHWIIAEDDGVLVGCLQHCPGKPFGRLEYLTASKALPNRQRALLLRDLVYAGKAAAQAYGSTAALCVVSDEEASWQRITQRRGGLPIGHGTMMMWRIT